MSTINGRLKPSQHRGQSDQQLNIPKLDQQHGKTTTKTDITTNQTPKRIFISSLLIVSTAITINLISTHFNVKNHFLNDVILQSKTSELSNIIQDGDASAVEISIPGNTSSSHLVDNNTNSNLPSDQSDQSNLITSHNQYGDDDNDDLSEAEEKVVYSFLATREQDIDQLSFYQQSCSKTGYQFESSIGSAPENCGITFTDHLLSPREINQLRSMAAKYVELFGETTTTNRESLNLQWINLHTMFRKAPGKGLLSDNEYELLINASTAAKRVVSMAFGVPEDRLFFTTVCQFTRYEPVTSFSEFRHIDKVRSPELIVTSILWLSTVDVDFEGGRLEFLNGPGEEKFNPFLIEPKKGRYAAWTSSHENPHGVHQLFNGERLALIFAFTANPKFGHISLERLRTWATLKKPSLYY